MINSAKVVPTLGRQQLEAAVSEACPLCLGRYSTLVDYVCASCEAPSCPECAVPIAGTPQVLCYACHVPTTH
jgi:hypothetical protein